MQSGIEVVAQSQGDGNGGEAWTHARAAGEHAGVSDVQVVELMAAAIVGHVVDNSSSPLGPLLSQLSPIHQGLRRDDHHHGRQNQAENN